MDLSALWLISWKFKWNMDVDLTIDSNGMCVCWRYGNAYLFTFHMRGFFTILAFVVNLLCTSVPSVLCVHWRPIEVYALTILTGASKYKWTHTECILRHIVNIKIHTCELNIDYAIISRFIDFTWHSTSQFSNTVNDDKITKGVSLARQILNQSIVLRWMLSQIYNNQIFASCAQFQTFD